MTELISVECCYAEDAVRLTDEMRQWIERHDRRILLTDLILDFQGRFRLSDHDAGRLLGQFMNEIPARKMA